ncbi:MAG: hypothetical protein J2P49_04510 [Methylocapsa sp.]|nr:hypothetical protein [Methylocapsa sp.]
MVRSLRRGQKTKAVAEVLAMIADEHLLAPKRPRAALDGDDTLYDNISEFCAALELYASRGTPKKFAKNLRG